jgi:hypothetical protein
MKLFLDDEREAPEGWRRVTTARETIALLEAGDVTDLSLDHDLGDEARAGTGYHVLVWLEEAVALHGVMPPQLYVHSANSGARPRMLLAIRAIERLASEPGVTASATTASGKTFLYIAGCRATGQPGNDFVATCAYDRLCVRFIEAKDESPAVHAEMLAALGWASVTKDQWICDSCAAMGDSVPGGEWRRDHDEAGLRAMAREWRESSAPLLNDSQEALLVELLQRVASQENRACFFAVNEVSGTAKLEHFEGKKTFEQYTDAVINVRRCARRVQARRLSQEPT